MPTHIAPGHDRYLVHPVSVRKVVGHQGVPSLVVGGHLFFSGADDPAFALRPANDPVHGLFKLLHEDGFLVGASRQNGGFIN